MNEPRNGLFVEYCAKDFLDGTNNLDVWEELAYRRLVDLIYSTNDSVKDDNKKLAWATKTGSRWPKIKEALIEAGKIEVVEGRVTNARCRKELEKTAKKIEQKRIAGKASAEARKETDKPLNNNETTSTAVITDVPTADPTAEQRTNNPLTQEERKNTEANASVVAAPPAPAHELAVGDKAKKSRKSPKVKSKLPKDWFLPMEWGQWAVDEGANEQQIRRAADRFKSHHVGSGTLKADWREIWCNWVRSDLEKVQNVKQSSSSKSEDLFDGLVNAARDIMDARSGTHNVVPLRTTAGAW